MSQRFPTLSRAAALLALRVSYWVALWAVLAVLAAATLALGPLEGIPHVQDEIVYELQARLLSRGALWEPGRLPRASHHYEFVINEARRYGVFPNGWPAILALGRLLGASAIVNPLLHGLTVVLGSRLAGHLAGRRATFIAAPFLALCPALLLQGASRMSHTLAATLVVLSALLLLADRPTRGRALALGAALGWLILTRPVDALAAVLVLGAAAARRGSLRTWAWGSLPLAVAVALVGLQNWVLEGGPLLFPQNGWFARAEPATLGSGWRYSAECNRLGFGAGHGCFPVDGQIDHTLQRGVAFAWLNLKLAGRLWFGFWPMALLCLAALVKRETRELGLIAFALWAALAVAYAMYWYHGACYGPRFHHAAAPLVIVTLAAGLANVADRLRVPAVLALLPLLAFAERMMAVANELPGYWGVDGRLAGIEQRWDRGPALLLVAYGGGRARVWRSLPNTSEPMLAYVATLRRGMWLEQPRGLLEFAEYQPALRDELVRRAAGRRVYLLMLHESRRMDYLVPLEKLPDPGPQRSTLPVPQELPFFSEPLSGGEPVQAYYAH